MANTLHTDETASQRKWRELRERQEARTAAYAKAERAQQQAIREAARAVQEARRERAYASGLVSDHNHDMDA